MNPTHNLIRVATPDIVERMATANRVPFTRSTYAASVTLGEAVYFWAAA
jgi:hypothetical protein